MKIKAVPRARGCTTVRAVDVDWLERMKPGAGSPRRDSRYVKARQLVDPGFDPADLE